MMMKLPLNESEARAFWKSMLNKIWLKFCQLFVVLFLKFLENRLVISLYWFTAQHKTSTLRRQKYDSCYSKFYSQINGIIYSA